MRVIIVGAGEVGSNIAASLAESHKVIVIDVDPEKVEDLNYSHDVLAIHGDGASLSTLREAEIEKADMLIASTDDDELNLVTCGTAKTLSDPFTIARVREEGYLETWNLSKGAFGVDFLVSTNVLIADDIIRIVGLPAALDVEPFAGGKVQMAEFEVPGNSDLAGKAVAESDRFEAVTVAALVRNGDITIPHGETVIEAEDRIIVIGRPDSVQQFAETIVPVDASTQTDDLVIVGGSNIGHQTAKLLEKRGLRPRLIEQNADRARQLAEDLPRTVVMEHDATDVDFLISEHIDKEDAMIAATDSDEKNLLVALLARSIGVQRTVAIVEKGEYADLFEEVGVDVAINPREVTAEEIVRFTQEGQIEGLALIEGRQAEVLEIEVDEESILAGRPIRESGADLPSEAVIGAITRQQDFIIPRGNTVIEPGDHVVLFVAEDDLSDVTAII